MRHTVLLTKVAIMILEIKNMMLHAIGIHDRDKVALMMTMISDNRYQKIIEAKINISKDVAHLRLEIRNQSAYKNPLKKKNIMVMEMFNAVATHENVTNDLITICLLQRLDLLQLLRTSPQS